MLSSKGAARLSFVATFIVLFLVFGIYCIFVASDSFLNFSLKKSSETNYEKELSSATNNYVNDYYSDIKSGETLIVKLSTLREHNYASLDDCKGYSIVNKELTLIVDSYINCGSYKSNNYEEKYE